MWDPVGSQISMVFGMRRGTAAGRVTTEYGEEVTVSGFSPRGRRYTEQLA